MYVDTPCLGGILRSLARREEPMTELWVERTGVRRYTGRSSRGAEVLVGGEDVEGVFTPGELMKIALAACSVGLPRNRPPGPGSSQLWPMAHSGLCCRSQAGLVANSRTAAYCAA